MSHKRIQVWVAGCAAGLLAAAVSAEAPEAAWVMKTVHGYRFALAVETALDPDARGDPRHARAMDHRVIVAIREEASGRVAELLAVSLDVAEAGFQGESVPMRSVGAGEARVYQAGVRLRRDLPYRILVYANPGGGARNLEAQFAYRHHH